MRASRSIAPPEPWRAWKVVLPCVLALAWSGLLMLADGLAGVMAEWDTPSPGDGWVVTAGLVGHCTLAVASVALLVIGLRSPSRRQTATLAAWLIIPAGLAWMVLVGRLGAR